MNIIHSVNLQDFLSEDAIVDPDELMKTLLQVNFCMNDL
jgi:hypothetical protein